MRRGNWGHALVLLLGFLLSVPRNVHAIPAFARRYRVTCRLCHDPIPKLTSFGEQFAANGYRMSPTEELRDTIATGDELLTLLKDLPLAVRLDMYAQGYADGRAATDFQSPYAIKLLSGGVLSKKISYFFYTLLVESGDLGGVEDAFVHFNDIGGAPVDLIVGQFQASDPIFKRELRLEFEDYAVYRARIGSVTTDLTYERGLMSQADLAGFTATAELTNGNGASVAQANGRFDVDASKNLLLHLSRPLGGALRLGAVGYYGRSHGNGETDRTRMLGVDATLRLGPVELNGQYLHRRDDAPTFTAGERESRVNGGFGELIVRPPGSRFYGFALYNLVQASRPLLDVGLGGPPTLRRYESLAGGIGHLVRRNIKVSGELGYDFGQDAARLTLGTVMAF